MRKLLCVIGLALVVISCKKGNNAPAESKQDSVTLIKTETTTPENSAQFETFDFPSEVQGCSCYFAKDKAEFDKEKYIYVDDYGNNAVVKFQEKTLKFPMEEGDFDPENFGKTLDNGDYKLRISGKKLKDSEEAMIFEGEMTLETKDGQKITSTIYGECGC